MTYHVPISRLPLLQDPPFVVALVLLAMAIGYRTLRLLGAPVEAVTRLERGALSAAIGLGLLQYLPFALGTANLLTPVAVRIGLLALAAIFARDIASIVRGIMRAWSGRRAPDRWIIAGAVLLAVPLAAALLSALCPCTDPDGMGYHLRAPKEWLRMGHLGYLPTLTHTNSPMGVEMLYTLALATWSDTAAKVIHYALALVAVYALGRRLRNCTVGFATVALTALPFPGANPPLHYFTVAYIDLGVMVEIVCAVLAWTLWRMTSLPGWLLSAALCCGLAASFKLTGLLVVMSMGFVILLEIRRHPAIVSRRMVLPLLALAVLPVVPWLARSWILTGNPVNPMLAHLFPTRDWSVEQSDAFSTYMRYYNWGVTHTEWGPPLRRAIVFGGAGLAALAGALLFRFSKDGDSRSLLLFTTVLTTANMLATGPYLRFFLPSLPLFVLVFFVSVPASWLHSRNLKSVVLLVLAGNGLLFVRGLGVGVREALLVATGRVSRDEYLRNVLTEMPLWSYTNRTLPSAARIAIVGSGDAYYSDRYCYVVKAYYQGRLRLDSEDHFVSDLNRDHIDFLMVPAQLEAPPFGPDTIDARNEVPLTHRLARERGVLLFATHGYELYRLGK